MFVGRGLNTRSMDASDWLISDTGGYLISLAYYLAFDTLKSVRRKTLGIFHDGLFFQKNLQIEYQKNNFG